MKKLVLTFALLAGAASLATAQDVRQPGRDTAPRPLLRRPEAPAAQPAVYYPAAARPGQPACACPAERSVDLVNLAANVVTAVHIGRLLRQHPELLPPPGTPAASARPTRQASASATASGRLGVKVGLGLANVTGVRDFDTQNVVGLTAGFMADFGLGEHLAFHPELLYSQKGAKGSLADGSGFGYSEDERLHYLDLPLLLRARASGFFLEAGPQLGYLLARRSEYVLTVPGTGPVASTDRTTDGTRRLDVGYVVGLGYALPQGWEVGLRYNGGLADVQDPSSDPKLRNSVVQLQVGYLF